MSTTTHRQRLAKYLKISAPSPVISAFKLASGPWIYPLWIADRLRIELLND